jgi:hypothetical protein
MAYALRVRLVVAVVALAVAAAMLVVQARPAAAQVSQPVTGTCQLATGEAGTFVGTFTITRFVLQGNQVFARGTLQGVCTGMTTGATQTVNQTLTVPVDILQATCEILRLQTGPIHLELLGLIVDISPILIVIRGERGTLLGGLLCGLARALSGGDLRSVVVILNQILGAV